MGAVLEIMESTGGSSPDERAESLMKHYQGKCVGVISLLDEPFTETEIARLAKSLQLLEGRSEVYVERHPRLRQGALRTDILFTDVVYFDTFPTIQRKSLLYKTGVEYGDYTINHVLGCAHGCRYPCYAMQISKRYGRVSDYNDWMHPKIVGNAMNLLEQEIPKLKSKIQFVHLSFMTDPFMYDPVNSRTIPWIQNLTLKIIERLNQDNVKVTVLTKGLFPSVLKEPRFDVGNEYGITLVSMNQEFQEQYEPFSVSGKERLAALRELHDEGLKTWVSIEPFPTPNIVDQDLSELLERVSFADKIIFGKWNYNPVVNGFLSSKEFYTQCSDRVIEFCDEHDIPYHIKEGTPRNKVETQDLFSKE